MIAGESFLETVIERARAYCNETDVNPKFNDDWIVRHAVMPAMVDVLARLNLSQDNPILARTNFTLESGTRYYQLPPCVGEVLQLAVLNDAGDVIEDARPRHFMSVRGSGWRLEGNLLVIDPTTAPDVNREFTLIYISNGDAMPHLAEDGRIQYTSADVTRLTCSASPILGVVDRRPNAYVGMTLRLIPESGPIEERVIGESGWEADRCWVETRTPFTAISVPDIGLRYEIAPTGSQSLYDAIALMTAMRLATATKQGAEFMKRLELLYRSSLKTIKDNLHYMQQRDPKHFSGDTRDNRSGIYLG